MLQKIKDLVQLYDHFALETEAFRTNAACAKGCAFCCKEAGSIDITTLEGLRIQEAMGRMLRDRWNDVQKSLAKDMKCREAGGISPCPFLQKNNACMIYEARPFACRRVYSLHRCTRENPPLISRQYMAMAGETLAALQRLDTNGYSGHIADILHMLDTPRFRAVYLAGDFKPEEIIAFGKTHGIVVNKMVTDAKSR